jgi:hypothetical protein
MDRDIIKISKRQEVLKMDEDDFTDFVKEDKYFNPRRIDIPDVSQP